MSATPQGTFREKAPRLSPDTLAEVIHEDVLAPPVRDATESIWLHGAFADPDSGIDREDLETPGGATGMSDVDVFVVIDGLGGDVVTTRFTASERGLLCRLAAQGELAIHTDADRTEQRERLGRPAVPDGVREADLPSADALATLHRAERTVFHAREFDVEMLQFRALDLTLGGRTAFHRLVGEDSRLRLWVADEG